MPEIRHNFTSGKMNKDLDERLVRNGEYRYAKNIQVRTTDGGNTGVGDAGTAQNLQGNIGIGEAFITKGYRIEEEPDNDGNNSNRTRFIGSVADEKTDKAYFFAAAPIPPTLNSVVEIPYTEIMEHGDIDENNPDVSQTLTQAITDLNNGKINARFWIDSIIEVDAISETSTPVFVDLFAITGRLIDLIPLPANTPFPGLDFIEIEVVDGSYFRVGIEMYL